MTDRGSAPGSEGAAREAAETPSQRGRLLLASSASGRHLARAAARHLGCRPPDGTDTAPVHLENVDFSFADGETGARLAADPNGADAFLLTSLVDPTSAHGVDRHYVALLAAARTLREWGAVHVTAVLPYLAYARQDKPTRGRIEPTTARLMADLARAAGIERLVTWHPHLAQIHGFYGATPVDVLDPAPLLVETHRRFAGREDVIVIAPDEGASTLVTHVARQLRLDAAVTAKHRPRPGEAAITSLMGDFSGKRIALVLDDMISSGGTVDALVRRITEDHGIEAVYLAASHNLCTEQAYRRLLDLHASHGLREVTVTNSIPLTTGFERLPFLKVTDLAPVLGRAIEAIHTGRPVTRPPVDAEGAGT